MDKFPIKIDLSIFFNDERRKVLLMFNPEWKTVECLQKRVGTLFGLDPVRFLSDDGCFIPPQESIEVVKFCSYIKAFIHNDTSQKKKSKKERKLKATISESESELTVEKGCPNDIEEDAFKKKRKYQSLDSGFASSTPNRAKRFKNDVLNATLVHHAQIVNKSSEITSTSEQMPPPLHPSLSSSYSANTVEKSKSKKKRSNISSHISENESSEEKTIPMKYSLSKEEAKLKHGRSALTEAMSINEDAEASTAPACPTSLPSSSFVNESKKIKKKKGSANTKNPFKNSIPNTKHIHYDESGEITTTTATLCSPDHKETEVETNILFHCALNDRDAKKPRIFQIQPNKLEPTTCKKTDIEIQESIVLRPLDLQSIVNITQINEAPSKDKMHEEERPEKSLLLSADNGAGTIEIGKTDLPPQEDHISPDEGNCSLNDSNITSSTAVDKYKETSMNVSIKLQVNESNGYDSSNIQTDKTSGDGVSMNQTSNSEENKTGMVKDVNESSVVSVDCVDLSIDLDDDDDDVVCKTKSKPTAIGNSQDVSNYDSSDVEEVSEVIDLNETEESSSASISILNNSMYGNIKLDQIMPFCTEMTQLPEIGDVVVFKVPYVSRMGPTCSTEYLAGEIQYINKRTKSIKLLILDGHSELCYVPSKFINVLDNSMCGQKLIQMKSSDMIQLKIWRKNKF